ncbi:hypothetical protein FDECE_14021 [Fusarium decemcellulare]|nr:hypothetical protein FDECE_14021 [Fusarium decemcellulare]
MDLFNHVVEFSLQRPVVAIVWTAVTALVLQVLYRGYQQRKFYRDLPGPPHNWLLGHLKVMGEIAALVPPNCHPQVYYTEIARRYKLDGIFYLDLWPVGPGSAVIADPDLLDQITVRKPLSQHPMADEFLSSMLGPGSIGGANGALWKRLHNAMNPAFSWTHIRNLTGLMVDECMQFRRNLDKLAETGEVFSMEQLAAKLIFDVIAQIVFNMPLHAQTTGSQDLDDLRELIVLVEGQADITIAYNPVEQISRWWRRRKVLGRLHPSMINKIHERFELLISEKIVPSRKDPTSILDLMLREHVAERTEEGGEKAKNTVLSKADEQLLLTNIKSLLVGGHGTTTDSICFIYMLLSKAPQVVEKMLQEHTEQFGADFQTAIDILVDAPEKLQQLPYTDAVVREALRMFPVGFGVREAPPGATITYNGRRLPIDNGLALSTQGHDVHYNPRFFPNPTEFRPERWLGPEEIPRSYFRTFGRGPRACLGQNLATNELKIILIMTIRHYSFDCAGLKPNPEPKTVHTDLDKVYGDIVFQELGLEGKPRGGMMMTVKKRELPFTKGDTYLPTVNCDLERWQDASSVSITGFILAIIPEPRYHLTHASTAFRAGILQARVNDIDPPLPAV